MTFLEYFLTFSLVFLYISCLFTVCFLTFRKGHWVLGILGIFLPLLWLIGAVLPAKQGSRYERDQAIKSQMMIEEMTR
ncbi:MAG: hypothetical protein L0177_11460 [Chloroflexi bacterium]|nr:hypothetical protein [Chloroflexota bacterium]